MSRLILILLLSISCANFKTLKYKELPSLPIANRELPTICIIRPPNQIGGNYVIHDNDKKIGILSGSSYFVTTTALGRHVFFYSDAWKESKERYEITLEKGKIYYIVLNQVKVGGYPTPQSVDTPIYAGKFVLVSEEQVENLFSEMNEVDLLASQKLYQ